MEYLLRIEHLSNKWRKNRVWNLLKSRREKLYGKENETYGNDTRCHKQNGV